MDDRTKRILASIHLNTQIKKYLISFCYFAIIGGISFYAFQAFIYKNNNIKLVNEFRENKEKYEVEKIMLNPRIDFKHDNNDIYKIKAKKAFHKNEEEVFLFDVTARGRIGNITSGQLKIYENGQRLEFSQNPVLTINDYQK